MADLLTTLDIEEDIAWITMDDGKVNVFSPAMLEALEARLDSAQAQARVTILAGRRGVFSAGFDLKTLEQGDDAATTMMESGVNLLGRMLEHPHPIIALCTGHAYPMGAFLLLAADLRLGVAGDWRIGLNEVAIGLTVPAFAIALARERLTPPGVAMIPTGMMFGPDEANRLGYLDSVVPEHELADRAGAAARQLLSIDLEAYAATKSRVRGPLRETILSSGIY